MDDLMMNCKNLRVLIPRLSQTIVESYWEKYEKIKDDLELMIETEDESQMPVKNTYLQETGFNVSLIAKNDKKLVKLNLNSTKILTENKMSVELEEEEEEDEVEEDENMPIFGSYEIDFLAEDANNNNNNRINDEDLRKERKLPAEQEQHDKKISVCYQCSKCSKLFTHKLHLKSHMQQHKLNDQPQQPVASSSTTANSLKIICNECGKQFNSQSDFNRHLQIAHNAVKPYKCSICSMSFYDISSKNRHEKEHSGLKPYRCYICGFEFTRASNLRAHLIKLHSSEIGKSVIISKTSDNKLKFEFDLDAISVYREQQRLNKFRNNDTTVATKPTNAVIYIKDPNNKSSDVQYMVVYVDGKPIFVQNPKGSNHNSIPQQIQQKLSQQLSENQTNENNGVRVNPSIENNTKHTNRATRIKSAPTQHQITKIPYLLAAAAAASNTSRCAIGNVKKEKNDHEYQHLVSLFKQKNEKLFNPLANNLQNTQNDVQSLLKSAQNSSVC